MKLSHFIKEDNLTKPQYLSFTFEKKNFMSAIPKWLSALEGRFSQRFGTGFSLARNRVFFLFSFRLLSN